METSRCLLCGRELSDPKSVDRSIGPVCWEHLKRRRLREIKGLMSQYEKAGWCYIKRLLANQGLDVEALFSDGEEEDAQAEQMKSYLRRRSL